VSFDLRSIRLAPGEQHRETLDVTLAPFTIGGEPYAASPDVVPADLSVTRLRNGWVFDEAFHADVVGACHRCLEPALVPLDVDVREFHSLEPDRGAEEDMTSEYLVDQILDTDRMATDAVVLAMPLVVVCRPDCAGLCPICGADLNQGACAHSSP
jgi:uncharacterized protein